MRAAAPTQHPLAPEASPVPAAPPITVTSAEFVRQFGRWQDEASARTIFVTHHGRRRLAVVSAAHHQALVNGAAVAEPALDDAPAELLVEHIAQGFVAFDGEMRVRAINIAACAFLKLARGAAIGVTLAERLPGIEETVGYAALSRAVRGGEIAAFEMPSVVYPGRWLRCQVFPYRDGAACLFADVTDEVTARRQTDARTATLAALAAHGGVGRATLSLRGTFAQVDEGFARLAGFAPEGLLHARLTDVLALRERARVAGEVEAVLTGDATAAIDTLLLVRSGEERPIRLALAPLRGQAGPDGAVAIVTPA